MKRALVTGITGQDGSYLTELLLEKGYEVHGIVRSEALEDPVNRLWRLERLLGRVTLHAASLESYASLCKLVMAIRPHECYHLAARSFVSYAFEEEFSTISTNVGGTHYLLSALYQHAPQCRFYFAGSSEMFGRAEEAPQNESTRFRPRSPYGISKVAGYHLTRNYRETHGLFAACGILFNHESPRRGPEYVTRKISSHVARIKSGLADKLRLGNLDARRDWGHARDYVRAMWLMLQQDQPSDYVIGTGRTHTVREFLEIAFGYVGLRYEDYVQIDARFYRPSEPVPLVADPAKAKRELGWASTVAFEDLVVEMVESDLQRMSHAS